MSACEYRVRFRVMRARGPQPAESAIAYPLLFRYIPSTRLLALLQLLIVAPDFIAQE